MKTLLHYIIAFSIVFFISIGTTYAANDFVDGLSRDEKNLNIGNIKS
jgi:hypothetical protein